MKRIDQFFVMFFFFPCECVPYLEDFCFPYRTLQWANIFFIVYSIYLLNLWESIMKSPPNSAKIPGRDISCLPTQVSLAR